MIACLPRVLGPAEEEEEYEEEAGGFAFACRMLSLYSLVRCSLTPLAMLMASVVPTPPRNVALTISCVMSSTSFSDALPASEIVSSAILI